MNPDCRNDCRDPFEFPKSIYNRPGLSRINYRIATYSDFLQKMFRDLNQNAVLQAWTHRDGDDPGIALLEGASVLADILTFYQERYANEAYLRTARWRESIADLVRLLGYRLSPGLGGSATFAFEVKGDRPVVIPAGLLLNAQVKGLEQSADFETIEEFVAEPALGKFNLYPPTMESKIEPTVTELRLIHDGDNASNIELEAGDRILIGDPAGTILKKPEMFVVENTRELLGEKLVSFKGRIQSDHGTVVSAYKLNRSFRHFGYNAPREVVKIEGERANSHKISFERFVDQVTAADEAGAIKKIVDPSISALDLPLDSEIDDLAVGQLLIIELEVASEKFYLERSIKKISPTAMTWGAISGGNSTVTLNENMFPQVLSDGDSKDCFTKVTDIRNIGIHEVVGKPFKMGAARKVSEPTKKNVLIFYGDDRSYQSLKNRRIQLVKGDIVEDVHVVDVTEEKNPFKSPGLRELTINKELKSPGSKLTYDDFPFENPGVTVYGNLVEATQGKTTDNEILGNGDSRQTFQTFKMPTAPLTYFNSAGETPPEVPELQIYVDDHLWTRVPSFFGRGPHEQIYIVREDVNGDSWVQFGDGKTGARLPSGIDNVVATFRSGIGAFGTLKEETTVQAKGRVDRLDKIHLPEGATGGDEAEGAENAREAAPGKIQSLDRLVSLKDFESETLAVAGVSKALAAWDLVDNVPTVVLTVLMETGREQEFQQVQQIVTDSNRCRGPQRFPVCVRQGLRQYVYLDAVYGLHPSYREESVQKVVKKALGLAGGEDNGSMVEAGLFALRNRNFGQDEYANRIVAAIQNVDGVLWAKITALGLPANDVDDPSEIDPCSFAAASDPSELILPAEPKGLSAVIACDSRHILSLFTEHLQLSPVSVPSAEVC